MTGEVVQAVWVFIKALLLVFACIYGRRTTRQCNETHNYMAAYPRLLVEGIVLWLVILVDACIALFIR